MRIGLVCPYGYDKGGGVQEVVRAIQSEFLKLGHDAYILTPKPQSNDFKKHDKMIFVGSATDVKMPSRTTIQMSASQSEAIDELLDEYKFDVLHFHEPWIPMISYQLLSRSKCVNVGTFHANLPPTAVVRTLAKAANPWAKLVLRRLHAFTAVSDAAAEYICSISDEPVAIVPNGLDLSQWQAPAKHYDKRKKKTILYVGRLEGRKGVDRLLHAFALLEAKRPDVNLLICGDGVDRDKLEMLAEDLELKNVTFKGYITNQEKLKLYQTSDLFCSPALYGESFGVVLLEAMATGLVTVAGDNPGYAGVMTGFGSLSLVDPKHSAEFARRLDLLLYEPDLRRLWRDWAANEMPQYEYGRVAEQYIEVYQAAIDKERG